jgi:hypothetical protein
MWCIAQLAIHYIQQYTNHQRLPIASFRDTIVQAVRDNPVVVLAGASLTRSFLFSPDLGCRFGVKIGFMCKLCTCIAQLAV